MFKQTCKWKQMIYYQSLVVDLQKKLPRNSFETLNFNRADYAKLNSELETVDWSRILSSSSATKCFASFMDVLSSTCSEYVPRKTTSSSSIHKNSFYKSRRPLMRRNTKINTMLSTVNYSKSQKLIDIEHKLMSSHNEERLHYENVAISRIRSDSKYFFGYADKYRKGKKCVGPLDSGTGNNELTSDSKDMCNILQNQYLKIFSTPKISNQIDGINSFFMTDNTNASVPLLDSIKVSTQDVMDAISNMRKNAVAGPDSIPSMLVYKCCDQIAEPLSVCFNMSLEEGYIPDSFKTAAVIPIYKGGEKSKPANCRSVSLISVIMKLLERIVRKAIVNHLDTNMLMNNSQHGFRKGRSCLSALLEVHDINI